MGTAVTAIKVGDRVCMEPGVPDLSSRSSKLGQYNVDPAVTFWAMPPIHGVLTPYVVQFTYKLPDNVSFSEGAMVEPFAIGTQAASRARIKPGDVGAVIGSGPIGIMVALAALAGGCSRVYISDFSAEKLKIAGQYDGIMAVNLNVHGYADVIFSETTNWGADVVFEASGSAKAYDRIFNFVRPGGTIVLVGLPVDRVTFDVAFSCSREVRIETVLRYANIFDRSLNLIASGKVDLKPLITGLFAFEDSNKAFERAASARPTDVRLQIRVSDTSG